MTRTARPVSVYMSVVLRFAYAAQDLENLVVRAGGGGQHRSRFRGPRFAGQVGDDTARGPHLRDPSGMIPDVTAESYCAAEYSVGDVDKVDARRPVHA